MSINSIVEWLKNVITTIPVSIVQSLICGFLFLVLSKVLKKIETTRIYMENMISHVKKMNFKLEISPKTKILPSRVYYFPKVVKERKIATTNDTESDFAIIVVLVIAVSILINWFVTNATLISEVFKWSGVIPLLISIVILFKISLTNKVQSISVKYIFYSIPISALTIYYGYNVVMIASGMSSGILTAGWQVSVYKILGIALAMIQQLIVYLLIFRILIVSLDYKNFSPQWIKKAIYKTSYLESNAKLIFTTVLFSTLSYLLTSGILYNVISKIGK